ncbi:MAG: hypothetical protein LBD68_08390 [Zoogloeaceae bacterium]|jgi:hypothetical protein|nr:hypothetical protein [Zoogloeaceae bacterium]
MTNELFRSAHAALTFAYNFSGQHYDRPLIARMASKEEWHGKGLAGLDGAAQAGMIRAEVHALGKLPEAIITARFAPPTLPCSCGAPCCCGKRRNEEWINAIAVIADESRRTALAGCESNGLMRREYVIRCFVNKTERESLERIAERHGIHVDTVSAHAKKIANWLSGRREKHGVDIVGEEQKSLDAIEARLAGSGVVERA